MYYSQVYLGGISDIPAHLGWAKELLAGSPSVPSNVIAHGAWEWSVIFVKSVFNAGWSGSALVVTLGSDLLTALILFLLLRRRSSPILAGALTLGVMLIGPLALFFPFDQVWYPGGYIWANIYHNPTSLLLRPFAIIQFVFSYNAIAGKKSKWYVILLVAIVSGFAAFAKPVYIICLLPISGIFALFRLIRKQPIDLLGLIFGIVIPSTTLLIWQFSITYAAGAPSQIAILPFDVMSQFSGNLAPKFILSIAFPLAITILYWQEAVKDVRIQLGWLTFFVGALYTYFLAELGPTYNAGNFIFCGEIALFMLIVACVAFLMERQLPDRKIGRWLILGIGLLQVFFGISFFFFKIYH